MHWQMLSQGTLFSELKVVQAAAESAWAAVEDDV